jgi:hypothetical protein
MKWDIDSYESTTDRFGHSDNDRHDNHREDDACPKAEFENPLDRATA